MLEAPSAGPFGGPLVQLSTRLVESDRLLFVLDGFDEIPGASGKAALEGIEQLGAVPVVVTSRTDELSGCPGLRARAAPGRRGGAVAGGHVGDQELSG